MKNAKLNKKKEKEWFFNIIEESLLNENFNKKYPNYAGGRIEIWRRRISQFTPTP